MQPLLSPAHPHPDPPTLNPYSTALICCFYNRQYFLRYEPTVTKYAIQQYNSSATSALARSSTPRPTNPQSVQYSTHLLLLQSSVFPALCTAVYAAVVEQWASNPEVDGAFCGRPWHPLHTQAICGGGDRSRLLTLGTTEPFACRCPNVNKMLQMCEKKKVWFKSLTQFDFTVDEGKEWLNPSRDKNQGTHRRRKVD